jgi:hypothetical protein
MANRTFSLTCFLLVATLSQSATVRAQQPLIGVDGCAILASVVYTEVTEARLGYSTGLTGNPFSSGRGEITLCNQTARSVTKAFASALRRANVYVTWGFHTGYSGDYCLSHFLSQCYPTGDPAMPPLSKEDRSFVMWSWRAIHGSISPRMSLYPGSDISRFQANELARSIRRSIAAGRIDDQLQFDSR